MDAKTIKRIREKYKYDKDIILLLQERDGLLLKLQDADILAMVIDVSVERGLNSRSLIGDARLNYGQPWEYEHADREILLRYEEGLEEVKRRLSD